MFSNTEFNHLKLKLDQLYLSLSGGKVNGETVFSKKVTFGSGDKVIKIHDGIIEGIGDFADTNFVGTRAEWENLSVAEKAKYLTMDFTDDSGFGDISDEDVTFTSSDVVDANANSWTVVSPIASGTTLNTLFSRVSQMFKNIRFLKNRVTNDFDFFLNQEKRVGTWINGEAIYKRTILINKSYNPTSNYSYAEDISSWYKNPIDNPINGMIVIDTKVLAWWDGDSQGTTRGYGKNATINTQNWVAFTGGHIFDIYVEASANLLYVRVTANAKLYLKYVTVYYYRLNGT